MNTALNRTVVALLTNQSGGSVAQGDVVIVDSANASAFTTTTTSGYSNGAIGVVLEPNGIASAAQGTVAFGGYVPKVNLSASASLGDLFKTHTVAKQAVRHAAPLVAGDFGEVLGTGTSPAALLWSQPASSGGGGGMTDPETTAGDMVFHDAGNTLARLPVGSVGQVLGVAGGTPIPTWQNGGMVQLAKIDVGGGGSALSFTSIPSGYRALLLILSGRGTQSGTVWGTFRFNNDSSAIYDFSDFGYQAGSFGHTLSAQTAFRGAYLNGTTNTANYPSSSVIYIPDYTGTHLYKSALSTVGGGDAANNMMIGTVMATWRSASAITRIDSVDTWDQYSTATLFGVGPM